MTVRQEENVFVHRIHIKLRVMLHDFKIERGKKVCTSQRSARVATLNGVYHSDYIPSNLGGNLLQTVHIQLLSGKAKRFPVFPARFVKCIFYI